MDEVSKVADDKYEWVDGKRVKPDWRYWYERAQWWAAKAKEFGYCPDRGVLQASDLTRAQQEAEPVARVSATALNSVVWLLPAPYVYPSDGTLLYTAPQPRIDLAQLKADVPRYTVKVERDGNAWMSIAMKNDAGEWCRWADIEKSIFYAALIAEQEKDNDR